MTDMIYNTNSDTLTPASGVVPVSGTIGGVNSGVSSEIGEVFFVPRAEAPSKESPPAKEPEEASGQKKEAPQKEEPEAAQKEAEVAPEAAAEAPAVAESPPSEEGDSEEKPPEAQEPEKTFEVLVNGELTKIPASATIKTESKSGKTVEFSLQDVVNDVYGKKEISRRINELHEWKKENEQVLERGAVFNEFADRISALEGEELLKTALNELNKVNPKLEAAFAAHYDRIFQEAEKTSRMSPEEKERYTEQKTLAKYRAKEEESKRQDEARKQTEFISTTLESISKKWDVKDKELNALYKHATENKIIDPKTTPLPDVLKQLDSLAAEHAFTVKAAAVLEKINKALSDDSDAINDLVDWQFLNPRADVKQLQDRAKKLYGAPAPVAEKEEAPKRIKKQKGIPAKQSTVRFVDEQDKPAKVVMIDDGSHLRPMPKK